MSAKRISTISAIFVAVILSLVTFGSTATSAATMISQSSTITTNQSGTRESSSISEIGSTEVTVGETTTYVSTACDACTFNSFATTYNNTICGTRCGTETAVTGYGTRTGWTWTGQVGTQLTTRSTTPTPSSATGLYSTACEDCTTDGSFGDTGGTSLRDTNGTSFGETSGGVSNFTVSLNTGDYTGSYTTS